MRNIRIIPGVHHRERRGARGQKLNAGDRKFLVIGRTFLEQNMRLTLSGTLVTAPIRRGRL